MALFRSHILIDTGTPAVLNNAIAVKNKLIQEIKKQGLENEIKVVETGNLGVQGKSPAIVIYPEGVVYAGVTVADVAELVEEHLLKGRILQRLVYTGDFAKVVSAAERARSKEHRVVLKNVGVIDPTSIEEYIAYGGYEGLAKALTQMKPNQVIDEIKSSMLTGRGGAGFPAGLKWEFTANSSASPKYVICNADEGEPGNFKDRLILEGDPHLIIEALIIAGYAVGAEKGYIYIRGEYHQSVDHTEKAISTAREMGLLGNDIFGSGFNFDIEIFKGAGAYICGEETALIESMEGRRGEARLKPPFPPVQGLMGKPTLVNNVETIANVPNIIRLGADWFKSIGTEKSKGTKIFSPCGDVQYPGVYEVPYGTTLREVIYNLAGGIKSGKKIKGVIMGGPSGKIVNIDALDSQLCCEDLNPGAGALIVFDEDKCIVDIMHNIAEFFVHESCGQCSPCREGNKRILETIEWWMSGAGKAEDIKMLKMLGETMALTSKCGLGQAATNTFISSLEYFEDEYLAHLTGAKTCPAGKCRMDDSVLQEVS
ncbi:MAG: NADH-ubiquinone oxidoreductase-F iron-sulfur binding region domain-containing protein [Armatimonadota bacterium]